MVSTSLTKKVIYAISSVTLASTLAYSAVEAKKGDYAALKTASGGALALGAAAGVYFLARKRREDYIRNMDDLATRTPRPQNPSLESHTNSAA